MSLLQEIEKYGLADTKQNKKYRVKRKPAYFKTFNTFTFYINGESTPIELVGSEFGSGENNSGIVWSGGIGKTVIGKGAGYYKYIFNGDIAMVRAYNSALSANDIKENYNLHAVRFGLNIK